MLDLLFVYVDLDFEDKAKAGALKPSQVCIFLGFINQVVGGSQERTIPWERGYSKMFSVIEFLYAVGYTEGVDNFMKNLSKEDLEERQIDREGQLKIVETRMFMEALYSARVENASNPMDMILGFLSLLTMDEVELN